MEKLQNCFKNYLIHIRYYLTQKKEDIMIQTVLDIQKTILIIFHLRKSKKE